MNIGTTQPLGMREAKRVALATIAEETRKRKEREGEEATSGRVENVKRQKMTDPLMKVMKRHDPERIAARVIGREQEIKVIRAMIAQMGAGERPLLAGIPKCGKNAIVRKLASLVADPILKINCLDYVVRCEDDESLLTHQITDIMKVSPNVILYFQHIDRMFNSDKIKLMLQMIYAQNISILASISIPAENDEARKIVKTLQPYNCTLVKINDLCTDDARVIVKKKLEKYPLPTGITISDACFDDASSLAQKFYRDTSIVQRTLNLVRRAANLAYHDHRLEIVREDLYNCIPDDIGVPRQELMETPQEMHQRIVATLNSKVIGQGRAVEILASRIFSYKAGLLDRDKPWGTYFFVGPTGVGKTELALQVAIALYGTEQSCIRLDMVEYTEEHSVSRLFGAPPGYEGHESGGQLTEALKKNPRRVIVFDELEKAHHTVKHALLNALGSGRLTDGRGATVSLNDCLIIMTSNLGAINLLDLANKPKIKEEDVVRKIKPLIISSISPEFCNRITRIVGFLPVKESEYPRIVELELQQRAAMCVEHNIHLQWDKNVIDYMLQLDFDVLMGMRDLRRVVEHKTLSVLKKYVLAGNPMEGAIALTIKGKELICRKS